MKISTLPSEHQPTNKSYKPSITTIQSFFTIKISLHSDLTAAGSRRNGFGDLILEWDTCEAIVFNFEVAAGDGAAV